ncbi:penicillin-binding protein 2 [Sinomonas sp. ASV486]|uniref:peptidoglycan D,D-transpeptidase FtsI family protein n=1 Tax=Sinomonas sp. ASV486 TaxID=3051170 RepID=UPI0027DAF13B|nr:penicillin-binding protein 2 [Sinomonas sp. ASV486]MDQ4489748.1 penicillin-binding protein 2 [Sinomonas sp. ASV486]
MRRLRLGLVAMLALLILIGGRLVLVQGLDVGGMAEAAVTKRLQKTVLPAARGQIVDSQGAVLASSVVRYNITVDQRIASAKDFTDLDRSVDAGDGSKKVVKIPRTQALQELSNALGKSVADVTTSITGDKPFNYVARNVTPDTEATVMGIGFPGILSEGVTQRVYPNGAVGGSFVGFLGSDGTALSGLEQTQDDVLKGQDGSREYEIGADGLRIPVATDKLTPAQDGKTVRLTINSDLQYFTQQAIQTQADRYKAEWGVAIVMDAKTGNILAMADSNSVDPNDPGKSAAKDRGVRAVTAAYEPGSVEKTITMASLIQEGKANPLSEYTIPPTYTIDGQTFADAFTHGTEHRTLAGILGYSMNTGTVMAGKELSPQQRYDWFTKFGIGQPVDIGLPGEALGILHTPQEWDTRQQYTVLFGQGVTQSTLQTARAYGVIANGGVMEQPRLIDAYVGPNGQTEKFQTAAPQQVVSQNTAQQVRDMLESNVTAGEVKPAAIDGYRVGAKTGTSEAPREDGVPGFDGVTSSLIGMAPMEDPRYVVAVVIQRPQGDIFGIGNADVFRSVMSQTLHKYGVQPSTGTPVKLPQYAQ